VRHEDDPRSIIRGGGRWLEQLVIDSEEEQELASGGQQLAPSDVSQFAELDLPHEVERTPVAGRPRGVGREIRQPTDLGGAGPGHEAQPPFGQIRESVDELLANAAGSKQPDDIVAIR
jgi:hypothetical protein